jgi:hypothetical protein
MLGEEGKGCSGIVPTRDTKLTISEAGNVGKRESNTLTSTLPLRGEMNPKHPFIVENEIDGSYPIPTR